MLRFSFWLTSLTANQKIFMTIEKAFERDFANRMTEEDFHFYKAGDDLASCRTVLEGIMHNGNHYINIVFVVRGRITLKSYTIRYNTKHGR